LSLQAIEEFFNPLAIHRRGSLGGNDISVDVTLP